MRSWWNHPNFHCIIGKKFTISCLLSFGHSNIWYRFHCGISLGRFNKTYIIQTSTLVAVCRSVVGTFCQCWCCCCVRWRTIDARLNRVQTTDFGALSQIGKFWYSDSYPRMTACVSLLVWVGLRGNKEQINTV